MEEKDLNSLAMQLLNRLHNDEELEQLYGQIHIHLSNMLARRDKMQEQFCIEHDIYNLSTDADKLFIATIVLSAENDSLFDRLLREILW